MLFSPSLIWQNSTEPLYLYVFIQMFVFIFTKFFFWFLLAYIIYKALALLEKEHL